MSECAHCGLSKRIDKYGRCIWCGVMDGAATPRVWQCECGYSASDEVCFKCGKVEPDGLKKRVIELERELSVMSERLERSNAIERAASEFLILMEQTPYSTSSMHCVQEEAMERLEKAIGTEAMMLRKSAFDFSYSAFQKLNDEIVASEEKVKELERELTAVKKNRDAVIHDLEGKLIEARGNVYESRKWGVALTRTLKNVESTNTTLRTRNAKLEAVLVAAEKFHYESHTPDPKCFRSNGIESDCELHEAIKAAREAK